MTPQSPDTTALLEKEYAAYLGAQAQQPVDDAAIAVFMTPDCKQVARQTPKWDLSDREEILRVLAKKRAMDLAKATAQTEAETAEQEVDGSGSRGKVKRNGGGKLTMRGLTETDLAELPTEERQRAEREGWAGLRVEADDGYIGFCAVYYFTKGEDGKGEGRERWVQCLHDLVWVGRMDGGVDEEIETLFGGK